MLLRRAESAFAGCGPVTGLMGEEDCEDMGDGEHREDKPARSSRRCPRDKDTDKDCGRVWERESVRLL